MKSLWISTLAVLSSIHGLATAENSAAPFYTFPNTKTTTSDSPVVLSQLELRLALASRLGLSQYHHLGNGVDVYKLQLVGSSQQRLWVDGFDKDGNVIVTVGGISGLEDFSTEPPIFELQDVPAFASVGDLMRSLRSQSEDMIEKTSRSLYSNQAGGFVDVISPVKNSGIDFATSQLDNWNLFENSIGQAAAANFQSADMTDVTFFEEYMVLRSLADRTIEQVVAEKATIYIHITSLDALFRKYGANSEKYKVAAKIVSTVLNDLIKSTSTYPSVVGLFPPSTRLGRRDDLIGDFDIAKVKRKEAPLSVSASSSPAPVTSISEDMTPITPLIQKKVVRLAPGRFHSAADCDTKTNSCNGRGSCIKVKSIPESWTCKCNATVVKVSDKANLTTYWGGNACQKRDVSLPFLLFASFAIGSILVLLWTIGKMMAIGEEELPGELSAGVTIVKKG